VTDKVWKMLSIPDFLLAVYFVVFLITKLWCLMTIAVSHRFNYRSYHSSLDVMGRLPASELVLLSVFFFRSSIGLLSEAYIYHHISRRAVETIFLQNKWQFCSSKTDQGRFSVEIVKKRSPLNWSWRLVDSMERFQFYSSKAPNCFQEWLMTLSCVHLRTITFVNSKAAVLNQGMGANPGGYPGYSPSKNLSGEAKYYTSPPKVMK